MIAFECVSEGGGVASLFAGGGRESSSSLSFRFTVVAVSICVGSCVVSLVGTLDGTVLDGPIPVRRTGPFGLKALLFPFNIVTTVTQNQRRDAVF